MAKRIWSLIEIIGTSLGFLLLFGPPSWSGVNRGITIVLAIVCAFALGAGIAFLVIVVQSIRQPPYDPS
jgi:hypothetical protein